MGYIKNLISKPDYLNCPLDIKQRVQEIRETAEPKYHLHALENYMRAEHYSAALLEIEWLKKNHKNFQDYSKYSEQIDQLIQTGQEIYNFYKNSLSEIRLSENHYLVSVLFDRESLINAVLNKNISTEEIEKVKEICGENLHSFSDIEYRKQLANHIHSISLNNLERFIDCMDYVSEKKVKFDEYDWPDFKDSIVKHNAEELSVYFREFIHHELITICKTPQNNKGELRSLIKTAFRAEVIFSEDELLDLSRIDLSLTEDETKKPELTEEEIFKKWERLHNRWPKIQDIQNEYKHSKIKKYHRDIKFYKENANYQEAYDLVNRALNDSETGAQDDFYFEKILLCLELQKLDEAKKIINEIGKRIPGDKLKTLETRERILRLYQKDISNPAEMMQQLIDLSKDEVDKGEVDLEIKKYFKEKSDGLINRVRMSITGQSTNNITALDQILILRQMEDEYKGYAAGYQEKSHHLLSKMSPVLLFDLGHQLLLSNETLVNIVGTNDVLEQKITSLFDAISKTEAYLSLFKGFIANLKNNMTLIDAVKTIIELDQNPSSRESNLSLLSEHEENKTKIIDLEKSIIILKEALDQHTQLLELIKDACQPELWKNAIEKTFRAKEDAFAEILSKNESIETKSKGVSDFIELKTFNVGLSSWQDHLSKIFNNTKELHKEYQKDKFSEAEGILEKINGEFTEIKSYNPFNFSESIEQDSLKEINIPDVRNGNILGFEMAKKQIDKLISETEVWKKIIEQQEASINAIEEDSRRLLDIFDSYNANLYDNERGRLTKYRNGLEELRNLNVSEHSSNNLIVPSIDPEENRPFSGAPEKIQTNKSTIDFFKKRPKRDPKIVRSLRRPRVFEIWLGSALYEQKKIINKISYEIRNIQDRNTNKPESHCASTDEMMRKNEDHVQNAGDYLKICCKLLEEIETYESVYPYPSEAELAEKSTKRQFNKMAELIINADLLGQRENSTYIETYRSHAIENICRGGN
jgi:hypothetical protein